MNHQGGPVTSGLPAARPGAAPDGLGGLRGEGVVLGPLHQLEVAHGGQLQAQVLKRFGRPVDDRDVQHDVVLVHCHIRLRIHRVCQA